MKKILNLDQTGLVQPQAKEVSPLSVSNWKQDDLSPISISYGELFCGPGGMGLGAKKATVHHNGRTYKIKHKWASDYDLDSCLTYQKNVFSSHKVFHTHVQDLDIADLDPIDIFSYGFPCNDFSIVGEQKGVSGAYGSLYKYGVHVLNTHNPKAFVAENVGGIVSANKGKAFRQILRELECAGEGYNLTVHKYKFEEYGVPQTRHRVIIIGIRKDLKRVFRVPKPTYTQKYVTAKMALESPPLDPKAYNHHFMRVSPKTTERLKYIKPWKNVWNSDMPKRLKIQCANTQLSHIYRRLSPDKPSYTITGSGGGGTYGYHWQEDRPLTNRERARLQTFPDSFVFDGNMNSVRKQIGMAVPPQVSQLIFESVLKTLFKIPYPHTNENYCLPAVAPHDRQLSMDLSP